MKFSEILHLVWINILENKSKVLLTSLGVVVGAATIVLVIAVGHGGEVDVQEQFKTLNVGAIEVTVSTSADMADQIAGMMPGGAAGQMPAQGNFGGSSTGRSGTARTQSGNFAGGFSGGQAAGEPFRKHKKVLPLPPRMWMIFCPLYRMFPPLRL